MKLNILLTLSIVILSTISFSQSKYVVKANEAYVSERYSEAAKLCETAYTKMTRRGGRAKEMKGDMAFKTAESYRQLENYKEANDWYNRAILLDYQEVIPETYLYNADMLQMMGEFDKAIKNYDLYSALVPNDERAILGEKSCEDHQTYMVEKTRHIIENLDVINTKQFDMAPMLGDRKKSKLYFSSSRDGVVGKGQDPRTGESYMSLWVTNKDKKGNWTEPYLVPGELINTEDNEGTVCFDSRFKKMFFTRCPNVNKQNLGCDIWVSTAKGKKEWNEPTRIEGLKSNDTVSVGHPATMDGKYLIFASDMAGGFGGRDLWYTMYDKKSDSWSAPVNMGSEINTKGNELFPSFALNGDLIFASDGFEGLGGLDIFRAARVGEENKWENPTNYGAPINGINNDYALVEETGRKGYFTSERKSGNGEYIPDIYSYVMPPNVFDLKVIISELGNNEKKIEDVKVVVSSSDGKTWEGYTDETGTVFWDKDPASGDRFINEESDYTINISKEGYHEDKHGSSVSTKGLNYDQNFVVDMNLLPKAPIRLPEVRYALNKWELLVDSTINSPDSLQFVFDLLEEYPGMVLQLNSNTDSRGSNKANQKLSENRAKACYIYLVKEKGVDPRRIVPVGKGETSPRTVWKKGDEYIVIQPINMEGVEEVILTEAYINEYRKSNPTLYKQLHQFNRRTDAEVISMDFDPETAPAADPALMEYVKYP